MPSYNECQRKELKNNLKKKKNLNIIPLKNHVISLKQPLTFDLLKLTQSTKLIIQLGNNLLYCDRASSTNCI